MADAVQIQRHGQHPHRGGNDRHGVKTSPRNDHHSAQAGGHRRLTFRIVSPRHHAPIVLQRRAVIKSPVMAVTPLSASTGTFVWPEAP